MLDILLSTEYTGNTEELQKEYGRKLAQLSALY